MCLRGDVGDGTDFESGGLQGTDGGFTTGTRALHEYVDLLDAVFHRLAGALVGNFVKWGIAAINAMVVASIIYYLGTKLLYKK